MSLLSLHRHLPSRPVRERLFTVKWDNSKLRIDPRERWKHREARGCHFVSGSIALETGSFFESMSDLTHHLEKAGTFELLYDDEEDDDGGGGSAA